MENTFWVVSNGSESYLVHHGIKGQKWGKRNGPPYPLSKNISTGKKIKTDKVDINSIPKNRIYDNVDKIPYDTLEKGNPFSENPDDFALRKGSTFERVSLNSNEKFKNRIYVSQSPSVYGPDVVASDGKDMYVYTYESIDDIIVAGKDSIINALKDIKGSEPVMDNLTAEWYGDVKDWDALDFMNNLSETGKYKDIAEQMIKSLNDRGFDAIMDPVDSNMSPGIGYIPTAMIFINDKKLKVKNIEKW